MVKDFLTLDKPSHDCPRLLKYCQNGEISSNLLTLLTGLRLGRVSFKLSKTKKYASGHWRSKNGLILLWALSHETLLYYRNDPRYALW